MRRKLLLVYFNISVFCVLVVGMEVLGQVTYYALRGYPVFASEQHRHTPSIHQQLFERHPYLVARLRSGVRVQQGTREVSTTLEHTRWTGALPRNTRMVKVAVVGGSTTFGSGVTDSDTWPARLQQHLGDGYAVTNYGVPGYSTAEAIIQLALVVPESRPDIVILYEGWNDIRNYHERDVGSDYYGPGMTQYTNLGVEPPVPPSAFSKLADVSAIARGLAVLSRKIRHDALAKPSDDNATRYEVFSTPDPFVDSVYRRNLTTLKLLAQQQGASVLFVPQVLDNSLWRSHAGSFTWTPHIASRAMPDLMGRFNGLMDEVCGADLTRCYVANEVLVHPWRHDDFIDEGHFSRQGNKTFAELLAKHIRKDTNSRPKLGPARASGIAVEGGTDRGRTKPPT